MPARTGFPPLLVAALNDTVAQSCRERVVREVSDRLAENGMRLAIHHWLSGEQEGRAFATVTEMAAELCGGAAELARADRFYAAAALTRQLLECGYLFGLANQAPEELARWSQGSRENLRRDFTPAKLRQRSSTSFADSEYHRHCEQGGHPHPDGRYLLRSSLEPSERRGPTTWADLALHVAEIWDLFVAALPLYDPRSREGDALFSPGRSPDGRHEIAELLAEWAQVDPLATRISFGTSAS
jgi:hypothetical protein